MEAIYLLIPIALVIVALAVKIFFWAVDSGQFDDLEGPAHSILFDNEPAFDEKTKDDSDINQKAEPKASHDNKPSS